MQWPPAALAASVGAAVVPPPLQQRPRSACCPPVAAAFCVIRPEGAAERFGLRLGIGIRVGRDILPTHLIAY